MKYKRGKVANRIKKAKRNKISSHHEVTTLDVKKNWAGRRIHYVSSSRSAVTFDDSNDTNFV